MKCPNANASNANCSPSASASNAASARTCTTAWASTSQPAPPSPRRFSRKLASSPPPRGRRCQQGRRTGRGRHRPFPEARQGPSPHRNRGGRPECRPSRNSPSTSGDLFKVSCRFECDSPVLIRDPATSGHLYRIAQEAISNAVKHGKARNVLVQLESLDDGVALRVKDDGVGLPDPPLKNAGMGLAHHGPSASMIGPHSRRGANPRVAHCTCELRQTRTGPRPEMSAPKTKIFLVDDHPLVREWLTKLIHQQPDLVVCGEAETRPEAAKASPARNPRWRLWTSPSGAARESRSIKNLKTLRPSVAVIVLSMHDESLYAERALRAGARGYIMKRETAQQNHRRHSRRAGRQVYVSEHLPHRSRRSLWMATTTTSGSPLNSSATGNSRYFNCSARVVKPGRSPNPPRQHENCSGLSAPASRRNSSSPTRRNFCARPSAGTKASSPNKPSKGL